MMPQKRLPIPKELQGKEQSLGQKYAQTKKGDPFTTQGLKDAVRQQLVHQNQNHCSYCDGYPLGATSYQSIDHFEPKSLAPLLACTWTNLFVCCDVCQTTKGSKFDVLLLKPDDTDYSFERYFYANYETGEIEINPRAKQSDQEKARKTLDILELNRDNLPNYRKTESLRYQSIMISNKPVDKDDWSYRHFLE